MTRTGKLIIVLVLATAVAGVLAAKENAHAGALSASAGPLPRLVELDAVDCGPCQAMQSVLEGLRRDCAGELRVDRIDVRAHRDVEAAYRVRFSPTQVFEDASGRELWRHEGFLSRADILSKWRELGYPVRAPAAGPPVGWLARLLAALGRTLQAAAPVALGGAFLWGLLSVLLSPCHLANIPLVMAFIGGQGGVGTRRAFGLSAAFALGVLGMITVIGALTLAAGRLAGDVGALPGYLVAAVLFAVGLHLLDVLPAPWSGTGLPLIRRRGPLAAVALGLLFGLALGPCTFAYLAPMLGVAFKVAGARPAFGAVLLLAYGLGHCSVIVAAGTSTGLVQRCLDPDAAARAREVLRRVCGALVLAGGVYILYAA